MPFDGEQQKQESGPKPGTNCIYLDEESVTLFYAIHHKLKREFQRDGMRGPNFSQTIRFCLLRTAMEYLPKSNPARKMVETKAAAMRAAKDAKAARAT